MPIILMDFLLNRNFMNDGDSSFLISEKLRRMEVEVGLPLTFGYNRVCLVFLGRKKVAGYFGFTDSLIDHEACTVEAVGSTVIFLEFRCVGRHIRHLVVKKRTSL